MEMDENAPLKDGVSRNKKAQLAQHHYNCKIFLHICNLCERVYLGYEQVI